MRFLLSSLVACLALSVPSVLGSLPSSSTCVKKTSSTLATGCEVVVSAATEMLTGSVANIVIPAFDVPNGILDNVYIIAYNATFQPTGSYQNTGGSPATGFTVILSVNGFGLFANPNGQAFSQIQLQNPSFIPGGLSIDDFDAQNSFGVGTNPCFDLVDSFGAHTTCTDGAIETLTFSVADNTFAGATPLGPGASGTFRPNYAQTGTYVAFAHATPANNNGLRVTPAAQPITTSDWTSNWFIGSGIKTNQVPLTTQFATSGSAVSMSNSITFSLTMQFAVQYDYHFPAVTGDPQFSGFQGQSFQVHGAPESYFALISAPQYYVNARFDYLVTGKCDYNETACFTHPGTYMGVVYVGMKDVSILIQAGPHATGFAGVLINDEPMKVGQRFALSVSEGSFIHMLSPSKLHLVLDTVSMTVSNSDLFVNFDLSLNDKNLLSAGSKQHTVSSGSTPSQVAHQLNKWYGSYNPLHGLIGQTWRNVIYNDGKLYQGDVTEYQLDKIIDHTFLYCVYETETKQTSD